MALVLTLASPLLYWVMIEHHSLRTAGMVLLVAMVSVTIILAQIEQSRAKEHPKRYRRDLALVLAALGWIHLTLVGVGAFVWPAVGEKAIESTHHHTYRQIGSSEASEPSLVHLGTRN